MPGSAAVATVTPPPTAAEERLLAAFQSANTLTSTYAASPERSVKSAKSAVFSRKHRSVKALLGGLPSSATSLRETRRSGRLPPPASGDDTAAGDEGHQQAPAPYHHHHHLFPRRGRGRPTRRDLDLAAQCGKFEQRPSDLFLEVRPRRLPASLLSVLLIVGLRALYRSTMMCCCQCIETRLVG